MKPLIKLTLRHRIDWYFPFLISTVKHSINARFENYSRDNRSLTPVEVREEKVVPQMSRHLVVQEIKTKLFAV